MKFSELQLEPSLQTSIDSHGYTEPTPIQTAAVPLILEGKDIAGLAQTGTGKTAAFLIPLIDRILKGRVQVENLDEEQKAFIAKRSFSDWRAQNFVLILVPTRELAEQVYENIQKFGEACGVRGIAVYGGTGYDKQKEAFKNQVEFVVATPGRLIDLHKEHFVDLKQVRAIVFDEADRMFDMGFKDDMKFILGRVPRERQFLVFSATLNFDVLNTAYQFGAEPVEINVSLDQAKAENVKDSIFHVGNDEKPMYLYSLLKKHNPKQAIIFSNYKSNVERVAKFLTNNGIPAMGISSLLTQAQRTRVIEQFKAENEKNILVATDVAARGLDIKGVDMVINYELPMDAESYVHRIGRTGRAGAEGKALSMVSDRDVDSLSRIEEYLKHKVEIGWMEESELLKDIKPLPREDFGGGRKFDGPPRGSGSGGGDRGPRRDGPRRDGPPRPGGDRGPRRDGPRRDGPPRPSGDRGPRRDGENQQAGPRDPNRQPNGPRRDGDRPQGDRGPRRDGPRRDGPRREGDRPQGDRGPRRDHQQAGSRDGAQANGSAGSKPNAPRRDQQQRGRNQNGSGAKHPQRSANRAPAASPGVMKKVSGFFKKLFGE